MTRKKHKNELKDTALKWLYKAYREQNDALPEEDKVGFRVWCRRCGILTPAQEDQIARMETSLSDTGYTEE
jgi:hypothetical protein